MYPNGTAKGDLRQVAYLSIALSLTSLMGACGQQRLLDDGPSDVQRSDVEKPPRGNRALSVRVGFGGCDTHARDGVVVG